LNAFKSLTVFVIVLVPALLIGYQNCSQSNRSVTSNDLPDEVYPPIAFNSIAKLGYSNSGSCTPEAIEPIELYSSIYHLCATARNSCEVSFLMKGGFQADESDSCLSAIPVDSDLLNGAFEDVSVRDLGYQEPSDTICTMQYELLVNVRTRQCAHGSNGCEIKFLKSSHGFSGDIAGFCD
jgi:hypothetical protein